jgi:predicted transcriptional regulator
MISKIINLFSAKDSTMKPLVLNVFDYVPAKTRMSLKPEFRENLLNESMEKAGKKYIRTKTGRRALSNVLGLHENKIYDWINHGIRIKYENIMKMANYLGISKKAVLKNTEYITAYQVAGRISIDNWWFTLDDQFTEWLGLVHGDGFVSKYVVGLSNNDMDLILFFADFAEKVFGFSKSRMGIILRKPDDISEKKIKTLVSFLKSKGFVRISFEKENKKRFVRREVNICVRISSRILVEFITSVFSKLPLLLSGSPNRVKAGYVRGFAAAEGTITRTRGQRTLAIYQKDISDLKFIKNILHSMGFENIKFGKGGCNRLEVCGRREIERYEKLVGFGCCRRKNRKLREVIEGYADILYLKSKKERHQDILEVIKASKFCKCIDISRKLGIDGRYINAMLNEMLKKEMITVDKSQKSYVYGVE